MNIDKYIGELLFSYDCVIVPEFGGFVANYSPARIHPTQHTFSPPSKDIVFNKNLKKNDGLLANAIANAENISFAEANRSIALYVENCNKVLKSGKKFVVSNVGTLYPDVEHNIQFEPDTTVNYLLDSFGLATFQSPAIKRENFQKQVEKQFRDREPIPAARKKINIRKYVALAVAAPIVFAMVWIPFKTDFLQNMNYAHLNPFATAEKGRYEAGKYIPEVISADELRDETGITAANGAYLLVLDENSEPVKLTVKTGPEENVHSEVPESTAVGPAPLEAAPGQYHVVGGCFMFYDNAERCVALLQKQNITASIIGKNDAGLHVVSLGGYSDRSEALSALNAARTYNPEAWIYKK